jgi:hypothetical protein
VGINKEEHPMATATGQGADLSRNRSTATRGSNRLSTETKHSFKTTEFAAMVAVIVGILIAAAAIKGGDTHGTDAFIAKQAWLYVAIVASSYMISRGLAKSGSREPYFDDGTNQMRDDGHR